MKTTSTSKNLAIDRSHEIETGHGVDLMDNGTDLMNNNVLEQDNQSTDCKSAKGHDTKNRKRTKGGKSLTYSASLLAVSQIASKILGAFFRIPLTNILGAEGMGIYQLVFSVFAFFVVLCSAGVPMALSKIVAENGHDSKESLEYFKFSIVVIGLISLTLGLLMFALAKPLTGLQGNTSSSFGLMTLAPACFFVGIIACIRGYFQGKLNMVPTAVSNIIEQILKLSVGIGLAVALSGKGTKYAVFGALLGVVIAEFVTLIYLGIAVAVNIKGTLFIQKTDIKPSFGDRLNKLARVVSVFYLVSLLPSLSNFVDSFLIVNMMRSAGHSVQIATSHFGIYTGPINSLLNVPIVTVMSLAIVLVPAVSKAYANRNMLSILQKSNLSIKIAHLVAIPCFVFFMVFSREIVAVLYPALSQTETDIAVRLLLILSPNIFMVALFQVFSALLQGLGNSKWVIGVLLVSIITKIVLSVALIPILGIVGASVGSLVSSAIMFVGSEFGLFKITCQKPSKNVVLNFAIGAIMSVTMIGIKSAQLKSWLTLIVGGIVGAIVYFVLIFSTNILTDTEIATLPMNKIVLKIKHKLRFWSKENESKID